jgi:adenylosuccinate synthase
VGPNAGHTLEFNDFKEILHTIPSGIFRENTTNIIGNGCVVDPLIFIEEIKKIQKHLSINVLKEKILISSKAHIILPSHPILDAYKEEKLGAKKIGSTLKGIGPTYLEKLNRKGLRFIDLQKPDFKEKALLLYNEHLDQIRKDLNSKILEKFGSDDLIQKFERWYEAILFVKSFKIVDTEVYINNSLSSGKSVFAEGAQGTFLDIDFGSYPFVTTSNTTIGGVLTGLGIGPHKIDKIYGLFKAYTTRVGEGPFPTELFNETGKNIQTCGREFGSTTGRPRRCGWLDLPMLKYACMLNGITNLVMSKADVLNGFNEIQVCIAYENNYNFPDEKAQPIYQKVRGWKTLIDKNGEFSKNFASYVKLIENYLGIPITIISTGPDRKDIIWR